MPDGEKRSAAASVLGSPLLATPMTPSSGAVAGVATPRITRLPGDGANPTSATPPSATALTQSAVGASGVGGSVGSALDAQPSIIATATEHTDHATRDS